jgi:hypothetical protein
MLLTKGKLNISVLLVMVKETFKSCTHIKELCNDNSTKTDVFRGHNSEMGNGIVKIKLGLHLVISSNQAKMKTLTVKKI